MILSAAQSVGVALVGGLVALDGTSVGQLMLSRPFVAACIGGLLVGAPAQGAAIGIVLEALHLAVLPVGAARYPEGGPAAVAAGAVYAAQSPLVALNATLLVLVVGALALEWIGGRSVLVLRQWNVRFAGAPPEGLTPGRLARRHGAAIAADFARGTLVTLLGVVGLQVGLAAVDLSGFPGGAMATVVRLAAVAALASALRLFGRGNYPFFLAGAAAGAVVAWLR